MFLFSYVFRCVFFCAISSVGNWEKCFSSSRGVCSCFPICFGAFFFCAASSVGNQLEKCFFDKSWDTGSVPPEGGSRVSRRPAFLGVASIITVSARGFLFCKSWGSPLVPHRMENALAHSCCWSSNLLR